MTISNLPHKFSSQFENISSSEDSKISKISLDNEVIELEKDNPSKSIREFESSSLDLPTSVNSDIMYYALSVKHPEARVSPIPLAEMISSEQTNVEISNFLSDGYMMSKK